MSRKFSNATYKFSDELANRVRDFLAASHNAEIAEVVRRAVAFYIDDYVENNEGFAKDFEAAKKAREALEEP